VRVDLATDFHDSPDQELHQSVTARFITDYNSLDRFASALERVLNGTRESAILYGESR
jgi:hypothetical protein